MNGCCPPIVPPQCQPVNFPGPPGQSSFSFITAPFAIPPDTATPISISMGSTAWIVPGQYIIIGDQVDGRGTFVVQSVTSGTTISALWADAAGDSVSGTVINPANLPIVTGTGAPGLGGANGVNSFTILTANSAIPVDTNTPVTFTVGNSQWAVVGQTIVVGDAVDGIGTFRITGIGDSTHITALWLNAVGDAPPLQPILTTNLAAVSPSGVPGTAKYRFATVPASPPATSGTGETTLISTSIPANTLLNLNDSLEFEAVFNLASNGGNATVKVYFGATVFFTDLVTGVGTFVLRGRVIRTAATAQFAYAGSVTTTTSTANTAAQQVTGSGQATPAETLSGAVLLKCTGTASAGSFTQLSLVVRLNPA